MKYIKSPTFKLAFISITTMTVFSMITTSSLIAVQEKPKPKSQETQSDQKPAGTRGNLPQNSTTEATEDPTGREENTPKISEAQVEKKTVGTNKDTPIISYVSLILSIFNIIGLGTVFFFLNKKNSESTINTQREAKNLKSEFSRNIKSIEVDINGQKQLIENRIKAVDRENQESIANIRRKVEDLQQTTERLSQAVTSGSQSSRSATRESKEQHRSSPAPVNNQPSYISRYNDSRQNFQDSYQAIPVEREIDNYKLSRSGKTEDVILEKQSQGNYLLFSDNGRSCIVPKHTFKMREDEINDVQNLFECMNYREDNYNNFILVEPAILTPQGDGTWQLKEKGKLQFG
jgi:hypothetical protein